jgi:putative ABC transport system permease protein
MEKEIKGIEDIVPTNQENYTLKYGRETYDGRVMAVTEEYRDIFDYEVETGRFLSEEDDEGRKSVIVLGSEVAETLFPEGDAVGQYVRLVKDQARSFKVVGVMSPRSSSIGVNFDTSSYVPYDTFTQRLHRIDTVGSFAIGTEAGADVLAISDELEHYLAGVTGNPDAYRIVSPTTIAEVATGVTSTLNLLLGGVAAISLLVGGIGIMNIMLVSVAERTREIGTRKALGASPRVIRGQFLTAAVSLTLVGGVLGMLLGSLISFFVTKQFDWSFTPQMSAFALGFLFSSFVGVFFGLYPAIRASNLDPVVALTFE